MKHAKTLKTLTAVFLAAVMCLCLSFFAAGAGDEDPVTITVDIKLLGVDNPQTPFAYLRYYADSKNHDPYPEYGDNLGLPGDSFQVTSASTVSGCHVTFLQPYYDFYSAVRVDLPDGSYTTMGANPLYGYVFDHWEGWENEADPCEDLNMPNQNEFIATKNVTLSAVFRTVEDMNQVYRIENTSGYGDPKWTTIGDMLEEPIVVHRPEPDNDDLYYYSSARCGERVQITYHNLYDDGYYSDGRRSVQDDNPDYFKNNYHNQFYMWSNEFSWYDTDRREPGPHLQYDCVVFEDPYEKNTSFLMPAGNVYIEQLFTYFDQETHSTWEDHPGCSLLVSTTKNVYKPGDELDVSSIHVTLLTQDYGSRLGYSRVFNKLSAKNWGYSVDPYADLYELYIDYGQGGSYPAFGDIVANDVTGCITGIFDHVITTFEGFDSETVGRKTIKVTYKNEPTGTIDVWVEDGNTATVTIQNSYGPSPKCTRITVPCGAEIWKGENDRLIVESSAFYKEYELEMEPQYRFKSWEGIPEGGVVTEDVTVSVSCEGDLVPAWHFCTGDVAKGQLLCNFDLPEDALYTKRPGYNCTANLTVVADVSAEMNSFYAYSFEDPAYGSGRKQIFPIAEPGYVFNGWEVTPNTNGYDCVATFIADTPASGATVSLFFGDHIKVDGQHLETPQLTGKTPGDKIRIEFTNTDISGNKDNEDYSLFCEWNQIGVCYPQVSSYDNFVWLEFEDIEDIADPDSHAAYLTVPTRRIFSPYIQIGPVLYTPYSFSTDSIPETRAVEAGTAFDDTGLGSIQVSYRTRSSTDPPYFNFLRPKYKIVEYSPEELLVGLHTLTDGGPPDYTGQTCSSVDTGDGNVKPGKKEYAVELPEYKKGDNPSPKGSIKENARYFRGTDGMPVTFDMYGINPAHMFIFVYIQPDKTAYNIGEDLDCTGLKIMTSFDYDATEEIRGNSEGNRVTQLDGFMDVTEFCTVGELNSSTPGEKYVTVEFMGMRTYFNVTVLDNDSSMSISVPEDSFRMLGENYVGQFCAQNAPADARYILYRIDENGEKQLCGVYNAGSDGSFSISGKGKTAGTETYCIGAKFGGRWQYCSEPFSIVWTPYQVLTSRNGNTATLTISDVEAEMSIIVANYDDAGRFIDCAVSPAAEADGTRQLTISCDPSAETRMFILKDEEPVYGGTVSWDGLPSE